jgi:hypothetical protein
VVVEFKKNGDKTSKINLKPKDKNTRSTIGGMHA